MGTLPPRRRDRVYHVQWLGLWLAALLAGMAGARAELQFDVFAGYGLGGSDGAAREGNWFPVICEVRNDGPQFTATIQVATDQFSGAAPGTPRRVVVDLPTNTRKRILIPMFAARRYGLRVEAVLLDARGRPRADRSVNIGRAISHDSALIGSLARQRAGAPALPDIRANNNQVTPTVVAMQPDLLPDHPIALEGLTDLYLNSEVALKLAANTQVPALLAWLHNGGHLILGIEQAGDINGTPWLKGLLPCDVSGAGTIPAARVVTAWVQRPLRGERLNPYANLKTDRRFDDAALQVIPARLRDGKALLSAGDQPLIVTASRGRGRLTVLCFSPENEPFRSWSNRPWFWARLTDQPVTWLANQPKTRQSGAAIDGVFGALIDSRQVRKLPIGWLLVLLLGYLAVIGPFDRWWLRKMNRQMLTWITFPAYVLAFSGLIYLIGYRLRAGDTEWNELHVVDVMPHRDRADFRGWSYGSIYSPVNARYPVVAEQPFATLRGEANYQGAGEVSRADIRLEANSYKAELIAPVWTSQLFVSEWWRQGPPPVEVSLEPSGAGHRLRIRNPQRLPLGGATLVLGERVHQVPGSDKDIDLTVGPTDGSSLEFTLNEQASRLVNAVGGRRSQWGGNQVEKVTDRLSTVVAASLLSFMPEPTDEDMGGNRVNRFQNYGFGETMGGLDVSPQVRRGYAVVFIHVPEQKIVPPLNRFSARHHRSDAVLRVFLPSAGGEVAAVEP